MSGRPFFILPVGKIGNGKSAISNRLAGKGKNEVFGEGTCPSGGLTKHVKVSPPCSLLGDARNIQIQVADTPGFGDLSVDLNKLADEMEAELRHREIDVVIVCLSVFTQRFDAIDYLVLEGMKAFIEKLNPASVYLLFTRYDGAEVMNVTPEWETQMLGEVNKYVAIPPDRVFRVSTNPDKPFQLHEFAAALQAKSTSPAPSMRISQDLKACAKQALKSLSQKVAPDAYDSIVKEIKKSNPDKRK